VSHKEQVLKTFQETNEGARQYLARSLAEELARDITEKAAARFAALLPGLPDVGGEKNWVTKFVPMAATYLAYYEAMKGYGRTAEDVGKMMYDLDEAQWARYPKSKALADGARLFTRPALEGTQKWAEWTQKKEYPANWVAAFVPGDGREFDFGYDYSECALCKYFHSHHADELAPYVCVADFTRSRAMGTGLVRPKALAKGDDVCNFRYKKGRVVTQDWATEIPLIRERMKHR
jgi:hypothetical protein